MDQYPQINCPKAVGVGSSFSDVVKPIYSEPNSICTETYIVIGPFNSKKECDSVISYIGTKFFHFLLSLKKITQDTTQSVYEYIPAQTFNENFDDKKLYKKYQLDDEEIEFIEKWYILIMKIDYLPKKLREIQKFMLIKTAIQTLKEC